MNTEHKSRGSKYTDNDGDRLTITWYGDGEPMFTTTNGERVILSREQVLDLYHRLGEYLMAHPAEGLAAEQPEQPATPTPSVALEAHAAVYGDRQDDYGHPREDFTRTAVLWTGLLQHKLAEGQWIEAEDIPRCQIAVKLARDVHAPKRDNRVDIAGYAITLDRLETGR